MLMVRNKQLRQTNSPMHFNLLSLTAAFTLTATAYGGPSLAEERQAGIGVLTLVSSVCLEYHHLL
jgi:hypothetical protein